MKGILGIFSPDSNAIRIPCPLSELQRTGDHRMNRRAFLALTAAAGALSLGLLTVNFGSVAPQAAAQATQAAATPELPASPKAADVVDAADAFLATLSKEQRAIAQIELTPRLAARWSNFPGGSNLRNGVFFRELKPDQVEAAALKVARIALPGRGGLLTSPGSPRGRRCLRQGAWRARPRRSGSEEGRQRPGSEESRRWSSPEEGARPGGRRSQLRGGELHDRVPGQAVEDHALAPSVRWSPSRHQHLLQGNDRRRDPLPRGRAADGLEGRSGQDARPASPDARLPARLAYLPHARPVETG